MGGHLPRVMKRGLYSAKHLSESIRKKRKSLAEDGVENMVDTAPGPQMNPQDIHNEKLEEQIEDTLDTPPKSEAPSDPADAELDESQEKEGLRRKMRVSKTFAKMGY